MKLKRLLCACIPDFFAEVVARSLGYCARIVRPGSEMQVEGIVRGRLIGPRFGGQGTFIGRNVVLEGWQNITFGRNVRINPGSQIIAGPIGSITIGDDSHVSRNSVLAGLGGIVVGANCKISSGVMIYTVTYDRSDGGLLRDAPIIRLPVVIGNDVHIGANATFVPGVSVGDNSTIGAGAVVTRDVCDNVTVAGVPARDLNRTLKAKGTEIVGGSDQAPTH